MESKLLLELFYDILIPQSAPLIHKLIKIACDGFRMEYEMSHDGNWIKVELKANGKFMRLPYMKGLRIGPVAYSALSIYGLQLKDIESVELSEIPKSPDKLILGTPTEKRPDSQI